MRPRAEETSEAHKGNKFPKYKIKSQKLKLTKVTASINPNNMPTESIIKFTFHTKHYI